jgi:hypothetical protein
VRISNHFNAYWRIFKKSMKYERKRISGEEGEPAGKRLDRRTSVNGPNCESRLLPWKDVIDVIARLSRTGPKNYLRLVLRLEAFKGLTLPCCCA